MSTDELTTLEIDPAGPAKTAIIWLHGLGADAHDFEPIVPHLQIPPELGLRFVFPNAPQRPVTVNNGMRMRAWYDVLGMDVPRREDKTGVHDSERAIQALIRKEQARGVPSERIVLAGFSQGGAMALHTGLRYAKPLAGILALSCYIPLPQVLAEKRQSEIPVFMAHGVLDAVVPVHYGYAAYEHLQTLGYQPEWHQYNMGHEVNLDEIRAIGAWLRRVLAVAL